MFGLHSQLPDLNSKQIRDKFILLDKVEYSQKSHFLMRSLSLLFLAQISIGTDLLRIGTKFGYFQLNT